MNAICFSPLLVPALNEQCSAYLYPTPRRRIRWSGRRCEAPYSSGWSSQSTRPPIASELCMLPLWSERSAESYSSCDRLPKKKFEGHWIHDCPTNNDREFDNKPRIKRTTGIPRSFLKTVDNPNTGGITQGVMVTPEGGYVIAQPDSWVLSVVRM